MAAFAVLALLAHDAALVCCPAQVRLSYVCATAERFFAVSAVLSSCVSALSAPPSARLLKHIIRCYLRLSDNARAREALLNCLPRQFLDATFTSCLKDDDQTKGCAPARGPDQESAMAVLGISRCKHAQPVSSAGRLVPGKGTLHHAACQ